MCQAGDLWLTTTGGPLNSAKQLGRHGCLLFDLAGLGKGGQKRFILSKIQSQTLGLMAHHLQGFVTCRRSAQRAVTSGNSIVSLRQK